MEQKNVSDRAIAAIYTLEHIRREMEEAKKGRELEYLLKTRRAHFSKVYVLPQCIIGAIVVDSGVAEHGRTIMISYYLYSEKLFLVADDEDINMLERLVSVVEQEEDDSPEMFFCRFLESLMQSDIERLQEIESTCYKIEEHLLGSLEHFEPTRDILHYRKCLLERNFYYQQLADLCDILAGNENQLFCEKAVMLITDIGKRADRLYDYSRMLQEYLVQVRELCQQQIDLEQNKIMQVLTVVATIFMPLTLIAGWYGMNFKYMPELNHPYGYWIVLGVSIMIVIGEIIFYKRKKYI